MKKKQSKYREIEVAHLEPATPKNVDFVEISMSHEDLEKLAQKHALILEKRADPVLRKHTVRRQEKLLRKIFKAASQVLTDDQFSIFVQRYVYNLPESEISHQVGGNQANISRALRGSIKKIQKQLRIPLNLKGFSKDRTDKDKDDK
jgi:DNA-directed RNA polymerase specialized sigma24 family protein